MAKTELGLLCSPSKRLSTTEQIVSEIKVSYGGGMGGANTTYYGDIINRNDKFITFRDINTTDIEIGVNFIVHIKPKKIVTSVHDTTEHMNYTEYKAEKQTKTQRTIHEVTDDIVFLDKYLGGANKNILSTETETI